jgi:hypothetical protein
MANSNFLNAWICHEKEKNMNFLIAERADCPIGTQ